jgi:IS30 family transposase
VGQWAQAIAAFADVTYVNELGVSARADSLNDRPRAALNWQTRLEVYRTASLR